MTKVVKLPIVGRCYTCGKPITEDELYADVMDGGDILCCEKCWNEYLQRCENILEQMKKEKQNETN